ncbi:MAG TPA: nuclear transport factor 2 family protein [Candidatus Limnocylindrales bacterium]|nr:nuclear transport factor 2 family protein [Candidatus Limnocylindrales bacterium]
MIVRWITGLVYSRGLRALERGDLDSLLANFSESCTLTFAGDSPLGAKLSTAAELRLWFERFRRLLPEPRFEIRRLVISGPPWNQRLASHAIIRSTVGGEPYENQFGHFLTLRWGKVVDDLIIEDTQMWERACRRLIAAGVDEAAEKPMWPVAVPARSYATAPAAAAASR